MKTRWDAIRAAEQVWKPERSMPNDENAIGVFAYYEDIIMKKANIRKNNVYKIIKTATRLNGCMYV